MSFLDDVINFLPIKKNPLTALQNSVMTIPDLGPATALGGALTHADAGPPGGDTGPQRVVAVLGPATTINGIAATLLPFYTTVASNGGPAAPTPEQLARAIVFYAKDYLHADDFQQYKVGLILPLPIEIDSNNGEWIMDAGRIGALAKSFNDTLRAKPAAAAAWRKMPAATPAALALPDPFALQTQAAAQAAIPVATLAPQLWTQALRNPSDTVLLLLATLRALDSGGPGPAAQLALAALNSTAATQLPAALKVLAATTAGNGILRRFRALLSPVPAAANAVTALGTALQPGGTLAAHRDVPETPAQQGGARRQVLGHAVTVGQSTALRVGNVSYTGPDFAGTVVTETYLTADGASLLPGNPNKAAILTLLTGGTGLVPNTPNGLLDSVRARDDTAMTAGLGHWRATHGDELPTLLKNYKAAAPDEFDLFFALHGLDVVQPGATPELRLNGAAAAPDAATLRAFFGVTGSGPFTYSSDWAARFRLPALVSLAYRRQQVTKAAAQLAGNPLLLTAASVSPFPATAYILPDNAVNSGHLATFLTTRMTNNLAPPGEGGVIGAARASSAADANTLACAVVDLTGGAAGVAYAGFHDDDSFYVGSMAKVLPMYAAHELRFRLQKVVSAAFPGAVPTEAQWQAIVQATRDAWGPQIRRGFPDLAPRLNVDEIPDLNKMFSLDPAGKVAFRKGDAPESDIAALGEFNTPTSTPGHTMTYYHWQKSMILWSNNTSASFVINSIGYPYINRLLRKAGFYVQAANLGLLIAGNYRSRDWLKLTTPRPASTDLKALTPRGAAHYKPTTNFVATPRQVARLLALAKLHMLFDADANTCDDMLTLMQRNPAAAAGGGVSRPFADSIVPPALTKVSSKIGVGDASPISGRVGFHDCAVIDRTVGGHALSYVGVVLGGFDIRFDAQGNEITVERDAWSAAAVAVDGSIRDLHP